MNILITGGCGFIGTNLVDKLAKHNHSLKILDNLSAVTKDTSSTCHAKLIVGDIRDEKLADEVTRNIDTVVHLAAHTSVVDSVRDPKTDCDININGTLNLLRACSKNLVKRFIFASSNAAAGAHTPPIDEEKLPSPSSPYGASKLACEGYCSAFFKTYGIETAILRFSNVYGPNSLHKSSVVSKFIKTLLLGKNLTIYGDGAQTRDFVYVDDICNAIILCISKRGIGGEIFQIGTGIEVQIIDLANKILAMSKENLKIEYKPSRKGEILKNFSNIEKACKFLAYKPIVVLDEGLNLTFQWFKKLDKKTLEKSVDTGDE